MLEFCSGSTGGNSAKKQWPGQSNRALMDNGLMDGKEMIAVTLVQAKTEQRDLIFKIASLIASSD